MRSVALQLWGPALVTLILIGSVPGFLLRLLVRVYPKDHPRRRELVAELYSIPYRERLLFVAQQLELAVTEGVPARWLQRGSAPFLNPTHGIVRNGFRGPQVCTILGITYRQLDYWARTDLIRPSITDTTSSDTQRRYSYRDLIELRVIKSLLDAGVSLQQARRAIEYLRGNLGEDIASASLVLRGSSSVLVRTDGELIDLMRRGEGVFSVMALGGVLEELDSAITELRPGDTAAS